MSKSSKPIIAVAHSLESRKRYLIDPELSALAKKYPLKINPAEKGVLSPEELVDLAGDASAILIGWGACTIGPEFYEKASKLKVVSVIGSAIRQFHPEVGWKKGVVYTNTARSIGLSVAEFALSFILHELNRLKSYRDAMMARVSWDEAQGFTRYELSGKTVGIVGFGAIGRRVAELMMPFGVELLVYDPYVSKEVLAKFNAKQVAIKDLFSRSKVITIHAGVTDETRGLIGAKELGLIQDNAVLVNTARSAIIDTAALVAELKKKRFRAALDVFDKEPLPADDPLRQLDNVYITPHVAGGNSPDVFTRNARTVINDAVAVLEGRQPENLITPEIFARMT